MHPNRREEPKPFDNIIICHHCYGLLDEDLKLQAEEIVPAEIVAA
jgi:hypothetical protein